MPDAKTYIVGAIVSVDLLEIEMIYSYERNFSCGLTGKGGMECTILIPIQ